MVRRHLDRPRKRKHRAQRTGGSENKAEDEINGGGTHSPCISTLCLSSSLSVSLIITTMIFGGGGTSSKLW